jgi:hypothetical protein
VVSQEQEPRPEVGDVSYPELVKREDVSPNQLPVQPISEEDLPKREEVKETVNEFRNFIANNQETQVPEGESQVENNPIGLEENKPKSDEDESDLYSIRNFNV